MKIKSFLAVLLCLFTLTSCGAVGKVDLPEKPGNEHEVEEPPQKETPDPQDDMTPQEKKAREIMAGLTAEEKIGQLFLVRCPTGQEDKAAQYNVGGYILFARDFENRTPEQMAAVTAGYQSSAKVPMIIAVDEEGGTVTRISRFKQYRSQPFKSPRDLYREGGYQLISDTAAEKARLLKSLGVNVNMGPVCDISFEKSAFMYKRSFGLGADETARYVSAEVSAAEGEGMGTVLKHYPGYGDLAGDSHIGATRDERAIDTFDYDEIPFRAGIEAGSGCVLVCHNIIPSMGDELPASLSPSVHKRLREKVGFEGVIMTDDLYMDAISKSYDTGEAAVMAIQAGNDMICCTEFESQIPAVIRAYRQGRISGETIDEALLRVLLWKIELGLILVS